MIEKRVLPTFQCYTCGNCETDFHKTQDLTEKLGFCLRFKENVQLEEKNIKCWTNKKSEHYKDLFLKVENSRTAKKHIQVKIEKQLDLFFDNQINPFENAN